MMSLIIEVKFMTVIDKITQGEPARLFPVLSNTSKEGRTTSIVLACMARVDEMAKALLTPLGQKIGVRTSIETFTEVCFSPKKDEVKRRPDGLIILTTGKREWSALVEAKVGSTDLDIDQIEDYRKIAKENGIDAVITISNQFTTSPTIHPIRQVRKSRSKIPAYHWSWMTILTTSDLLLSNDEVADVDQSTLLNELRRFLSHESAGVKGFERMPKEWGELCKLVSAGGRIPSKSEIVSVVLEAWHQETRDLSLILSRLTETKVEQRLSRRHRSSPAERLRAETESLRDTGSLIAIFEMEHAAAPVEVTAAISRRSLDVGMSLRAPLDKKSSKARVNWLLRQLKGKNTADCHIRLNWPGKSEATQFSVAELLEDSSILEAGKEHLQVNSFYIFMSKRIGARFTQQANFITDLEIAVPQFYRSIGQHLTLWKEGAPKIREEKPTAQEVSVKAISLEANDEA